MILRFEGYQIDTKGHSLSYRGKVMDVEPTVFKIIAFLAKNRDTVVTRELIFSEIWQDKCVSDSALSNHIKNARKILRDDGSQQRMIKTVHRRGYQFVGQADELNSSTVEIMPLSNTMANKETEYYGEAIANQLVASLSSLPVITIRSCRHVRIEEQAGKNQITDSGYEPADYLLTGNYIEQNGVIRLNVELVENRNHSICWHDSIELESSGIFVIQDLVANMVTKGMTRYLGINIIQRKNRHSQFSPKVCLPQQITIHREKPHLQLL